MVLTRCFSIILLAGLANSSVTLSVIDDWETDEFQACFEAWRKNMHHDPMWRTLFVPGVIERVEHVLGREEKTTKRAVLHVGAHTGALDRYMSRRNPRFRISAVDVSSTYLEKGKQKAEEERVASRIEFQKWNLQSPIQGGGFDYAVSTFIHQLIPTMKHLDLFLAAIYESMKPGATLLLFSNPICTGDSKSEHKEGGRCGLEFPCRLSEAQNLVVNAYFWKSETYVAALKAAGFTDIKVSTLKRAKLHSQTYYEAPIDELLLMEREWVYECRRPNVLQDRKAEL